MRKLYLMLKFTVIYLVSHCYVLIADYYFDKSQTYAETNVKKWTKCVKKSLNWHLRWARLNLKLDRLRVEIEELIPELKEI